MGKEGLAFDPLGEMGWELDEEGREKKRGVSQDAWYGGITKREWEGKGGVRELVGRQVGRLG